MMEIQSINLNMNRWGSSGTSNSEGLSIILPHLLADSNRFSFVWLDCEGQMVRADNEKTVNIWTLKV